MWVIPQMSLLVCGKAHGWFLLSHTLMLIFFFGTLQNEVLRFAHYFWEEVVGLCNVPAAGRSRLQWRNWAAHWVMKSVCEVAVWMRWLCLCLPIRAEYECTLLSPPPLFFFHLSCLVHLTHTLLSLCFHYLQYSLHHPVSLSFSSSCFPPSLLQIAGIAPLLSYIFLPFFPVSPPAAWCSPHLRLWEETKQRETAQLSCWVGNE